jgi:hypothetical protein
MSTPVALSTALGLLACFSFAAPSSSNVLKAVPAKLDPSKAYILVDLRKGRALSNAQGTINFARYDMAHGDLRGLGRAASAPLPGKQSAFAEFRNRPIGKAKGVRQYLFELEPDTWVIAGVANTSFSLGSSGLRVESGQVVDLGVVSTELDATEGSGELSAKDVLGAMFIGGLLAGRGDPSPSCATVRPRGSGDLPLPAGLNATNVSKPEFVRGLRFGNYLGGLVNRIEGVNGACKPKIPAAINDMRTVDEPAGALVPESDEQPEVEMESSQPSAPTDP